jgi:hypothetical protein
MKYDNHTGKLLPDDTLTVMIRQDLPVHIVGLPHDLRQHEADRIIRIITAHAENPIPDRAKQNPESIPPGGK